jgi:hypothetical protein
LSGLEGTYAVSLTGPAIYSTWETRPGGDAECSFARKRAVPLTRPFLGLASKR